jgi:hypothetical protein
MKNCQYADQIDDYLLNRLVGAAKDQFEEHYFNCPSCFQMMEERDALVTAIKSRGAWIFKEEPAAGRRRDWVPAWKRAVTSFTPRQWATVGVAAAVILFAVIGILPRFQEPPPQFVLSDNEVVRGASLTLISPVIDVRAIPTYFEWHKLGEDVEYRIYVYNSRLLWTASTKDTRIEVPQDVKQQMVAGQKYSWQVKAFSRKGTLIAVSSRVQFQVSPGQ